MKNSFVRTYDCVPEFTHNFRDYVCALKIAQAVGQLWPWGNQTHSCSHTHTLCVRLSLFSVPHVFYLLICRDSDTCRDQFNSEQVE